MLILGQTARGKHRQMIAVGVERAGQTRGNVKTSQITKLVKPKEMTFQKVAPMHPKQRSRPLK